MVIVDFGHQPRPQMIKMAIVIPEVGLDKFGDCHFLKLTQKIRLI